MKTKIFFLLISMFGIISNITAQIPTNGLVGYWPFNGNANDESGNNYNGTVYGATLTSDRFGINERAYYFNGLNNYIYITNSSIVTGNQLTISCWFKSLDENDGALIITGNQNDYNLQVVGDSITGWVCTDKTNGGSPITGYSLGNNYFENLGWNNVVLWYNGSEIKLFLNNTLINSIPAEGNIYTPQPDNLTFGAYTLNGNPYSGYYNGFLDDIRIYDRALELEELETLYYENGWQTLNYGLIAYYPFNGNANDESGNENNGTVFGALMTSDRFGNENSAYSFDGSSYIEIEPSSTINTENMEHITISIWGDLNIYSNYNRYLNISNKTQNVNLDLGNYDHQVVFTNYSCYGCDHATVWGDSVSLNEWHHVVVSMDFSNKIASIYLNGSLKSKDTATISNRPVNPYVHIGKHVQSTTPPLWAFNGKLDDVRIYNRLLSDQEISSLYNENACVNITINDTTVFFVSNLEFESISPKVYYEYSDNLTTNIGGCDSVINRFTKYIYNPNYYTDTLTITVYDSISVTDTLFIDVTFTDVAPPNNKNRLKVYPNPTKDKVFINTGTNFEYMHNYKIRIVNLSGSVIFDSFVSDQLFEVNISMFGQTGLYLIQIIDSTNQIIEVRKIILE